MRGGGLPPHGGAALRREVGPDLGAASSPYALVKRSMKWARARVYSCVPSVSITSVASMQPTCAARSRPTPQPRPVRKPARKASPTPVGSTFAVSSGQPTTIGSSPTRSIRTPWEPSVVTRVPTLARISWSVQPDFDSMRPFSYSLEKRYVAPSIRVRMLSPSMRAICCEKSAAKGIPRVRHSSVWRSIASGSSAPMRTRSSPPTRSATAFSSISRASLIAPV